MAQPTKDRLTFEAMRLSRPRAMRRPASPTSCRRRKRTAAVSITSSRPSRTSFSRFCAATGTASAKCSSRRRGPASPIRSRRSSPSSPPIAARWFQPNAPMAAPSAASRSRSTSPIRRCASCWLENFNGWVAAGRGMLHRSRQPLSAGDRSPRPRHLYTDGHGGRDHAIAHPPQPRSL